MSQAQTYTIKSTDPRTIEIDLKRGKEIVKKPISLRIGTVFTIIPDNKDKPLVDLYRNQMQQHIFNRHLKPAINVQASEKSAK